MIRRFIVQKKLAVGVALATSMFAFAVGCDKSESTQPAPKPKKVAKSDGNKNDAALMRSFINENKGDASAGGDSLPAGHPPVPGMSAPPANAGGDTLPKGHPPLPSGMRLAPPAQGNTPVEQEVIPLKYDVPESWTAKAPTSSMRKAQFMLPGADENAGSGEMILYFFGARQGGSVKANIDRWVGQFKTAEGEPIPDSGTIIETTEVNGIKVTTLDIAGHYTNTMGMGGGDGASAPQRMLAAVVETPGGNWFFKGTGPLDTMAKQKDAFDAMIKSLEWKPDEKPEEKV